MPKTSERIESVIGLDVAKATVTLHDRLTLTTITVPNTPDALLDALTPYRNRRLAVCEATGGYEDRLLAVLAGLGIPAHRGDGGKISAFARSLRRAKTDRIDAAMLARYGAERGDTLPRHVPATRAHAQLAALVHRRIDLVEARKIEKTRAKAPKAGEVEASFARAIAFLDTEIACIEQQIQAVFEAEEGLAARKAILQTIPGIAHATAAALLALMPELGTASRRRAAALAAVAPHPRDSGTSQRARTTTGGRRVLRPILFIAALTAIRGHNPLASFFQKLVAR